jgi:hypothetical protein
MRRIWFVLFAIISANATLLSSCPYSQQSQWQAPQHGDGGGGGY